MRGQSDQADALILTRGGGGSYSGGRIDAGLSEMTGGGRV